MSLIFNDRFTLKIKVIPSKSNPDDKAPKIKYFKLASELFIDILFFAIRINKEKVWSSNPK